MSDNKISDTSANTTKVPSGGGGVILDQNQIIGLVGATIIVLGCFSPFIHAPVIGSVSLIDIKNNYGYVMILVVLFYVVACVKSLKAPALLAAIIQIAFIVGQAGIAQSRIAAARTSAASGQSVLDSLASSVAGAAGLDWGIGVLGAGALLALLAAVRLRDAER